MKLKKVKIIIRSMENIKKDWTKALRGHLRRVNNSETITFPSIETFSKALTPARLSVLEMLIKKQPKSIYELAKLLGRDFKNVHMDVKVLSGIGFIELKASGTRRALTPKAKYSGFELDLAA